MDKKRFFLYTDYKQHLNRLSLEEKGMLLDAILDFADDKEVELEGAVGMAFSFITAQMVRDNVNYENTCEAHREAGAKGGAPKGNQNARKYPKSTENNRKQPKTTKTSKTNDIDIDIDKDIDINTNTIKVNYDEITGLYNSICKSLPEVTRLSEKRKQAIRSRLKTYSVDDLKKAFRLAEESDFISGRSGKWTGANFDWLMKEANLIKVLEGNYKNNKTSRIEINPEFRRFQEEHELVHFNVN